MTGILSIFNVLAVVLGPLLRLVYQYLSFGNYLAAILIFVLIVRAATFPLNIKSQKSQCDRARLAPQLARLQKKYGQDRQKMAQKQQELYKKKGVSMTGGCLPQILQIIVLFGIIAVIYKPLTYIANVPDTVITASVNAIQNPLEADGKTEDKSAGLLPRSLFSSSMKELELTKYAGNPDWADKIQTAIQNTDGVTPEQADAYFNSIQKLYDQFRFFNQTLLDNPWNGFNDITLLWLIPLFSGLTALGSAFLSMRNTKVMMEGQPGAGCSNNMMLWIMPAFSLFMTFGFPGAVGIYWIFSNILATAQVAILNKMYSPVKARMEAQAEYDARREQKRADKERLALARRQEDQDRVKEENNQRAQNEAKRLAAGQKKQGPVSQNPNKAKRRADGTAAAEDRDEEREEPDTREEKEEDNDETDDL